jgi:hypothetical protein
MPGGILCNIELTVMDHGKFVSKRVGKSHSFVANFAQFLLHSFDGVANTGYTDITNVARPAAVLSFASYMTRHAFDSAGLFVMPSPAATTNRGIVIGTSNTEFDISQYNMQSLIPEGLVAGAMSYGAMATSSDPIFSSPDILLTLTRDIANQSGAEIIVREIGLKGYPFYTLYIPETYKVASKNAEVLFIRDVVPDTPVANGQVLNVTYVLKTVV